MHKQKRKKGREREREEEEDNVSSPAAQQPPPSSNDVWYETRARREVTFSTGTDTPTDKGSNERRMYDMHGTPKTSDGVSTRLSTDQNDSLLSGARQKGRLG